MDGIAPSGAASNVSSAYGGSASDRQIIERSSILNQGKKGKSQLEPEVFDRGRRVASKRIHVEAVHNFKTRAPIQKSSSSFQNCVHLFYVVQFKKSHC